MNAAKVPHRFANRLPLLLAIMALLALLYFFAPDRNIFYPRCLFHSLTGLHCPMCGGTRATHQLLHGNFTAAFALNPLFVIAIPLLLALASIHKIVHAATGRKIFHFVSFRVSLWIFAGVMVIFAVLRNMPAYSWMSP